MQEATHGVQFEESEFHIARCVESTSFLVDHNLKFEYVGEAPIESTMLQVESNYLWPAIIFGVVTSLIIFVQALVAQLRIFSIVQLFYKHTAGTTVSFGIELGFNAIAYVLIATIVTLILYNNMWHSWMSHYRDLKSRYAFSDNVFPVEECPSAFCKSANYLHKKLDLVTKIIDDSFNNSESPEATYHEKELKQYAESTKKIFTWCISFFVHGNCGINKQSSTRHEHMMNLFHNESTIQTIKKYEQMTNLNTQDPAEPVRMTEDEVNEYDTARLALCRRLEQYFLTLGTVTSAVLNVRARQKATAVLHVPFMYICLIHHSLTALMVTAVFGLEHWGHTFPMQTTRLIRHDFIRMITSPPFLCMIFLFANMMWFIYLMYSWNINGRARNQFYGSLLEEESHFLKRDGAAALRIIWDFAVKGVMPFSLRSSMISHDLKEGNHDAKLNEGGVNLPTDLFHRYNMSLIPLQEGVLADRELALIENHGNQFPEETRWLSLNDKFVLSLDPDFEHGNAVALAFKKYYQALIDSVGCVNGVSKYANYGCLEALLTYLPQNNPNRQAYALALMPMGNIFFESLAKHASDAGKRVLSDENARYTWMNKAMLDCKVKGAKNLRDLINSSVAMKARRKSSGGAAKKKKDENAFVGQIDEEDFDDEMMISPGSSPGRRLGEDSQICPEYEAVDELVSLAYYLQGFTVGAGEFKDPFVFSSLSSFLRGMQRSSFSAFASACLIHFFLVEQVGIVDGINGRYTRYRWLERSLQHQKSWESLYRVSDWSEAQKVTGDAFAPVTVGGTKFVYKLDPSKSLTGSRVTFEWTDKFFTDGDADSKDRKKPSKNKNKNTELSDEDGLEEKLLSS